MNAEIVAVGTELLLGQIANTNAQWISERLADVGVNVYFHSVVGDNPDRLKHVFETARDRSDLVIVTGGLGPTKDDLTKEVIASCLGKRLVTDQQALKKIEDHFAKTGRKMTDNNRKQALVIEGSRVLENHNGLAPGMILTEGSTTYVLMPGVPSEMKGMFLDQVLPALASASGKRLVSRVLRFFGIGESALETKILDLIENQTNPTIAPLAKDGEVTIRLTAAHSDPLAAKKLLDETEQRIRERTGDTLYGYGDQTTLAEVASHLLREHHLTVSSAESLTGGLFAKQITDVPGASDVFLGGVVSYVNAVKEQVLNVPVDVLQTEGAVSAICAEKMACAVRVMTGSDLGISFTGVAGPNSSEGKTPGTVFIGFADGRETRSFSYRFNGTREQIRHRTVLTGFDLIRRFLLNAEPFGQKNE
jgi:nicotinamide-nucleotide amidase